MGDGRNGTRRKTGLRSHRHHQPHGPGCAGLGGTPWNPGSSAFWRR